MPDETPPTTTEPTAATPQTGRQATPQSDNRARAVRAAALFKPSMIQRDDAPGGAAPADITTKADALPQGSGPEAAVPVAKPGESLASQEQALARALQNAIANDRKTYDLEQKLKQVEAEREAEKARLEKLSPEARAMMDGRSYEDLTRDIVEGKFTPRSTELQAVDAASERIARLEEQLKARDAQDAESLRQRQYQDKRGTIAERLKAAAEKYSVFAQLDHAPDALVQRLLAGSDDDFDKVAEEYEGHAFKDVNNILKSDHALKKLFADPELKARIMKLIGTAPAPAEPARNPLESPRELPSRLTQETPTRHKPAMASRSDRAANAMRIARDVFGGNK